MDSDGWLCAVDSGFGLLWRVGSVGVSVSGLLINSGAFSRLSACLGDALGVRCGPLPFLSIFPSVAWPLIRGLRCSVSHMSIAVFGFCWYSFNCQLFLGAEEDYYLVTFSSIYFNNCVYDIVCK